MVLEALYAEGPGKYRELESLRKRFARAINAYYLFEHNKTDGDFFLPPQCHAAPAGPGCRGEVS